MTQPPYPPPGYQGNHGPGNQGHGPQGYGAPQPYWQAPYGQAPYGQMPQGRWPQYPPPPKKSAGRIIGVVAAVFAIPVVIAAIVGITSSIRGEPPTTANTADDFKAVCKNGSVSNAADYQKPYKVVTFYESVTGWSAVTMLGAGEDYSGANLPPSSINVVACLTRRAGTEKKEGTCDYDSGGDKDRVSRYSVDYDVELREAKTGKRIKSLGSVRGPSTRCPVVALYTASSHKMYGDPDKDQLNAMLKEFAAG